MRTRTTIALTSILSAVAAPTALADFTGSVYGDIQNNVSEVDGFGAADFNGTVIDLWAESNDAADVLLNVYDFHDVNHGMVYYQSFTGGSWLPNNQGPPFETPALMYADSYVSIGGYNGGIQSNANGTGLDPNFGGTNAAGPGAGGGWYNSDPGTPIGQAVATNHTSTGLGVFIGRFSYENAFTMACTYGNFTWNQGIGTPGHQGGFEVLCPSPGPLAVFMIAGVARKRRRMN